VGETPPDADNDRTVQAKRGASMLQRTCRRFYSRPPDPFPELHFLGAFHEAVALSLDPDPGSHAPEENGLAARTAGKLLVAEPPRGDYARREFKLRP
jgi:hypothetical protein